MIAITKTELRENLKKYLDLASTECVVVTMGGGKSIRLVPSENMSDTDHFLTIPEVRNRLLQSIEQAKRGEVSPLTDDKLKKLFGNV